MWPTSTILDFTLVRRGLMSLTLTVPRGILEKVLFPPGRSLTISFGFCREQSSFLDLLCAWTWTLVHTRLFGFAPSSGSSRSV